MTTSIHDLPDNQIITLHSKGAFKTGTVTARAGELKNAPFLAGNRNATMVENMDVEWHNYSQQVFDAYVGKMIADDEARE